MFFSGQVCVNNVMTVLRNLQFPKTGCLSHINNNNNQEIISLETFIKIFHLSGVIFRLIFSPLVRNNPVFEATDEKKFQKWSRRYAPESSVFEIKANLTHKDSNFSHLLSSKTITPSEK